MYVYQLDWNHFDKCLEENAMVILGVYAEDTVIDGLFYGVLKQLQKKIGAQIVVGMMERAMFEERYAHTNQVYPKTLIFQNKRLLDTFYGIKNSNRLMKEMHLHFNEKNSKIA
ncbi:MAG: hypothetical protein NC090_05925 [Anaeroplasma bactoclasticum]|nr:hypothetical protein [Anaeroplasma bactoclasticum]